MIHTYRHAFRCGISATVLIDDDQTSFAQNVIKWSQCPYGHNPQLSADYMRWWYYIQLDFHKRSGRMIVLPIGNPGTWPTPTDGWKGIPPEG